MKKPPRVAVVVDASVARASNEPSEPASTAHACGAALKAIKEAGLHLAWSDDLDWEWLRKPMNGASRRPGHASRFARLWLREMQVRRRVKQLSPARCESVRQAALRKLSEKECDEIEKDMHLVEAALASDRRVLSLDDAVRALLAGLDVRELRSLFWVSPTEEECEPWVQKGAKPSNRFRLTAYKP